MSIFLFIVLTLGWGTRSFLGDECSEWKKGEVIGTLNASSIFDCTNKSSSTWIPYFPSDFDRDETVYKPIGLQLMNNSKSLANEMIRCFCERERWTITRWFFGAVTEEKSKSVCSASKDVCESLMEKLSAREFFREEGLSKPDCSWPGTCSDNKDVHTVTKVAGSLNLIDGKTIVSPFLNSPCLIGDVCPGSSGSLIFTKSSPQFEICLEKLESYLKCVSNLGSNKELKIVCNHEHILFSLDNKSHCLNCNGTKLFLTHQHRYVILDSKEESVKTFLSKLTCDSRASPISDLEVGESVRKNLQWLEDNINHTNSISFKLIKALETSIQRSNKNDGQGVLIKFGDFANLFNYYSNAVLVTTCTAVQETFILKENCSNIPSRIPVTTKKSTIGDILDITQVLDPQRNIIIPANFRVAAIGPVFVQLNSSHFQIYPSLMSGKYTYKDPFSLVTPISSSHEWDEHSYNQLRFGMGEVSLQLWRVQRTLLDYDKILGTHSSKNIQGPNFESHLTLPAFFPSWLSISGLLSSLISLLVFGILVFVLYKLCCILIRCLEKPKYDRVKVVQVPGKRERIPLSKQV